MKKTAKWTSTILTTIFTIVLLVSLYSIISSRLSGGEPQIFGYQLKTVLSGSMEPGIHTGSIIAIKPTVDPTKYKTGDVITFKSIDNPNVLVTHRVVKTEKIDSQIHYTTKGDNNDANDTKPIPSTNVVGEYHGFTIPYIGYALSFYGTKAGKVVLLIIPGILLLGYSILKAWKTIASIEEDEKKEKLETPKSV
ncbi:signal peptidase I [Neobacillus drentensis]|uniref:signal peptidase I SipW n=1 Tax=Neobacillus drentensis TaxID=220684 RepID=UPI0030037733